MLTTWDLIGVSKRHFRCTGIFLFQNESKMSGVKNTVTWQLYLSVLVSHIVPAISRRWMTFGKHWLNWLGAEGSHTHTSVHTNKPSSFSTDYV